MINFDYRFPLFDSIMYGSLSPFLSANHFTADFGERSTSIGLDAISDEGMYAFKFYKPTNFKCKFYYRKLISETFLYCNELLQYLEENQDADTRAYLRLTILDKHLKTCLIKLGETIQVNHLSTSLFLKPSPDTAQELFSNSYIFHLLKGCLVKAYLEVQFAMRDVVQCPLSENMLYTAVVGELPPVNCYMKRLTAENVKQRKKASAEPKITQPASEVSAASKPEITPPTVDTKFHTVKDLVEMKIGSDRTIRRLLEKKELVGIKQKNNWLIEETELQQYLKDLKSKTNHKPRP
ncbi:MAG: helix-turn-helix domain-containing protein [Paludibacter sp.]